MKKIITIITCFIITLHVSATNIRGKIVRQGTSGAQPAAGVRVDLMVWNGTKWVDMAFAVTGPDGFYYFLNYDSGTKFFICVSGKYYPPQPIVILDIPATKYQDIPTIIN